MGGTQMGPYPDRIRATDAAIDMADRDGRNGRNSQVLVRREDRELLIEWTYGRDPYPEYPSRSLCGAGIDARKYDHRLGASRDDPVDPMSRMPMRRNCGPVVLTKR